MRSVQKKEAEEFDGYLRSSRRGLLDAMKEPARFQPYLDAVTELRVERVLTVGGIYHLTGKQTDTRLFGSETFQTRWLLGRELSRHGLTLKAERPDPNPPTPAFVIRKEQ